MAEKVVSEIGGGRYGISRGIKKSDLEKFAIDPKTQLIQIAEPLSEKEVELLESIVFSKRSDIQFRVYAHYNQVCNLTFLERIPSLRKLLINCILDATGIESICKLKNIELIGVDIFNLDNFDFLNKLNPFIRELHLGETKSKKPKIDSIARFSDLKILYLEGQQNGIEVINQLKNLEEITLRSISTSNIDYIKGLQKLWSVDVKLGGIKNFEALTSLPNLKYLELWQVRDLSDLSFISKLTTLQHLYIQSLKQLKQLPDFSNCHSLRRIYLENLKGLTELGSLKTAPNLEEFIYVLAQSQAPEKLIPALENSIVKRVCCRFGSDKKNNLFDELAAKYGKEQYRYTEFIYK